MAFVVPLQFPEARRCVIANVTAVRVNPPLEQAPLSECVGRVLARDLVADRDYPPLSRSIRDGFAVRRADLPGALRVVGEVRAGECYSGVVGQGEAVEIMTGAPVPAGADAVVMVERTHRDGNFVDMDELPETGQFINPLGAEARRGLVLLEAGRRIDFAAVALAATIGETALTVYRQPTVAILPTGDEIVPVDAVPLDFQVRNSNAHSLAAQVALAGGRPKILPVAPDEPEETRRLTELGLESDLLLLSGGVSAGKYDVVEQVLASLGAQFYFDRVLIQPGQPLVFGRARDTFFFGLPGNPVSTMVTFAIFGRAALELLGGQTDVSLPIFEARLTTDFRHKPGLTRFLPAHLSPDGSELTPIPWRGSSDVPAMARANAFLVAGDERESWKAGERIGVLLK